MNSLTGSKSLEALDVPEPTDINKLTAPVRGRVGDDITQGKDDEGSVRNCRNLYIFEFLK